MKMTNNKRMDLFMTDLYYTFSDLVDLIDALSEKLEEVTDIIKIINDIVENSTLTAISMEKFYIQRNDIKKVIEFTDLYGNDSKYRDTLCAYEIIARKMHNIAQDKILTDNN